MTLIQTTQDAALYIYISNNISNASYQNDNMYLNLNTTIPLYNKLYSQYLNIGNQDTFSLEAQNTQILLINLQNNVLINETGNAQILIFVSSLQTSFSNKYGDINQYLQDNNIKVSLRFAEYSAQAGFIINSNNIY